MAGRSRGGGVTVVAAVLVLCAAGCAPAGAPQVGPVRLAPPRDYRPDTETSGLAVATEGSSRVVVWGGRDGDLLMDRFDGSTGPIGAPRKVLARYDDPDTRTTWGPISVALADGFLLAVAPIDVDGIHGLDYTQGAAGLIRPDGRSVVLRGGPRYGLGTCGDDPYALATVAVTSTGSSFLVAAACPNTTNVYRVTTGGEVTRAATLPAAAAIALSSTADGALLVFSQQVRFDVTEVRAQRLRTAGTPVGAPLDLDRGHGDLHDVATASSNRSHLVAWTMGLAGGGAPDLLARTVGPTGALGPTRLLADGPGSPGQPALVGGADGSWFAAWTDAGSNGDTDIRGTKVSAGGTVGDEDGRALVGTDTANDQDPLLARGRSGTASLVWLRGSGVSRTLAPQGTPVGDLVSITRAPIVQECPDVAAGQGQYLVTWQEPSTVSGYELFAQRYRPDGTRVGPVITLSAAPASVYCPVAAWNGSNWLVVWTDGRSGSQDVYGTVVSADGSVDLAGGSVISAEAGAQRRPAVAGTGSGWVVAWGDFRNGNEDIYAARIAANGTVRDPDGLPVTTAPGWQQAPAVASMGGATLVAWTGPAVERRLLRADGSFAGGSVRLGTSSSDSQVAAAASGTRFAVLFSSYVSNNRAVRLALVHPDGAAAGTRVLMRPQDHGADGLPAQDLTFDGSRFVFTVSSSYSDFPNAHGVWIGTVAGVQVFTGGAPASFYPPRVSALPAGRSLLVGDGVVEPTVAVAPVVDAP